jgi:undecaprenyl-phosphate galactose phosphotransferase
MSLATYGNRFSAAEFQSYAFSPPSRYDWSRLHAAAVDRELIDRAGNAEIDPADEPVKRVLDLFLTIMIVLTLSPALLFIAYLVRRDGGPALFAHKRVGRNGRAFRCLKFRTMVMNADQVLEKVLAEDPEARAEWERDFKLRDDPRITRLGRFLRTTSLDELPQLFNVLRGDMSLVGPRPIINDEICRYGAAFHDYARCRPGITGAWQVSGRNDVSYGSRVKLDQNYARFWSFRSDIAVLWKTIFVVIARRGAY